jgi:hypothetical protein
MVITQDASISWSLPSQSSTSNSSQQPKVTNVIYIVIAAMIGLVFLVLFLALYIKTVRNLNIFGYKLCPTDIKANNMNEIELNTIVSPVQI